MEVVFISEFDAARDVFKIDINGVWMDELLKELSQNCFIKLRVLLEGMGNPTHEYQENCSIF